MEPKSGSRLTPADGMHVAIEISKRDFGTSNRQLYKSIYRFCTFSNNISREVVMDASSESSVRIFTKAKSESRLLPSPLLRAKRTDTRSKIAGVARTEGGAGPR